MSEMVGSKNGKSDGLSPGFKNNPYKKISDLFFNSESEYIISIEDNYLKNALTKFLEDRNLEARNDDFQSHNHLFISLEGGFYNFIDRPDYKGKKIYELPLDWTELIMDLEDYLEDNPVEKKEPVIHNKESWNQPTELQGKTDSVDDTISSESLMNRIKDKLSNMKK